MGALSCIFMETGCKGTCKWALMNVTRLHGSQCRGRHNPPHSQGPHMHYPQNHNLRALSWGHSCLTLTDKWAAYLRGKWRRPSGSHFLDWQAWKEKGLSECSPRYISDTLFFLPLQSQNTHQRQSPVNTPMVLSSTRLENQQKPKASRIY